LIVGKKLLREKKMDDAALIEDARKWASQLVQRESRGSGDTENAMRRVSQRYGIDFGALWGLRYRPPRRIFADTYLRLRAAYEAECERQMRLLRHELEITKAKAGAHSPAVRAASALVGQDGGLGDD
jgi:hypothetical protein